jgi:hypothetical protein
VLSADVWLLGVVRDGGRCVSTTLTHPGAVQARLEEIERDLAERQRDLEAAALDHWRCKRDKEKARAEEFLTATGTVAERNAKADRITAGMGMEAEARWEGLKAVMRTLDTRAAIGMSLLRAQGRGA